MNDPQAAQRWAFTTVTPMGDTHSSYEIRPDLLRFASDAVLGEAGVEVPWAAVGLGCTAWLQGMGGRGGPDMGRGVPSEMEWLLLSRTDPGAKPFMRNLPQGDDREALLAALRERLGERWIGEKLALQDAQQRLQISTGGENLKAAGLVLAVMALLVALVILLGLLLHPVVLIPVGFLVGGWLFRGGLAGMRDGITVANTPTAKVASAAMGLVEFEGRARTANPSPAMITGRPCVWWDVSVKVWYQNSGKHGGEWRQLAARHGGYSGVFELEDDTGRVPVWTDEAMLLLSSEEWESGKQTLPAGGKALIDEIGLQWRESGKVRVSETRLEADGEVYVLGTLDERSRVPDHPPTTGINGLLRSLRTGEWKTRLLRAIPAGARMVVAVLIGFLSIFGGIGRGGERVRDVETGQAPAIAPAAAMVWKGHGDRPFIISNRRESEALAGLRRQSLWRAGFGVGILCFTLYQLIELFTGA